MNFARDIRRRLTKGANVSVHTDAKNATRKSGIFFLNASGSFFFLDAPRQKLSDQ